MNYDQNQLLKASAPLALEAAGRLCQGQAGADPSCAWYHGVWQYFRLLGVVASPTAQQHFYRRELQRLHTDCRRILISGASDYGMLSVVLDAYRNSGITPQVTVLDRCETPLFLNRWYAERFGLPVTTIARNLSDYHPEQPFDLICTHAFFGNFSRAQRDLLLASWHDQLRPGGRVLTMNRIRPGIAELQGFTSTLAEAFVTSVVEGEQRTGRTGIRIETLVDWARTYTRHYRSHPVTSLEDFRDLFTDHGFLFETFQVEGSVDRTAGPSTPGQAMRAYLVAERR